MFDRRTHRTLVLALLALVVGGLLLGAAQGALVEARLFFSNLAARAPLTRADVARAAYAVAAPAAASDIAPALAGDVRHRPQAEPPAPPAATLAVTIRNDGPADLCAVYISPAGSDIWEDDWLERRALLSAGSARGFPVAPGLYDLRVLDCAGAVAAERRSVQVSGPLEWRIGPR